MNLSIIRFAAALLAVAAFTLPASAHETKLGDLVLHHAWARATPGGAKTGAVYVRIDNHGMADDKLIGVSADIAAKVEVHQMTMENGTMKMSPAGDLDIPAQGSVALKPHGLHIMLMGLKQPLQEFDTFPVTVTFEKAGSVEMEVQVMGIGASDDADDDDHESDDHDGMDMN